MQNDVLQIQNVNSVPGMVIGNNMNSLGVIACSVGGELTPQNANNRMPVTATNQMSSSFKQPKSQFLTAQPGGSLKIPNQQSKNYQNIFKVGKKQIAITNQLSDQGESSASSQQQMMQSQFDARRRLSAQSFQGANVMPQRTRSNDEGRPSAASAQSMSSEISLPNIPQSSSVSNQQKNSKIVSTNSLTGAQQSQAVQQRPSTVYIVNKSPVQSHKNRPSSILGQDKSGHLFTNDFYAQNLVNQDNDKENTNIHSNKQPSSTQASSSAAMLNPQASSSKQPPQQRTNLQRKIIFNMDNSVKKSTVPAKNKHH